ncbi:MAG TPA: YggS family pyridoxal phosphate-dependent enzyme [Herpetosiphonaceae bacterium]
MTDAPTLGGRIDAIRRRMADAARRAGRDPGEIALIGVTKTHPAEQVAAARAAGLADVGENRVQEAEDKRAQLGADGDALRWHLIGHLQRNKARRAVQLFDLIHSVDSLKLAEALSRLAEEERGGPQPILLQLNVSGEASKEGFDVRGGLASAGWEPFLAAARAIAALPMLEIRGLMTIAPYSDDLDGVVRPCFRALRQARDELIRLIPAASWRELSMGMSGDFEAAIEEGATLVRVGTAIFGAR